MAAPAMVSAMSWADPRRREHVTQRLLAEETVSDAALGHAVGEQDQGRSRVELDHRVVQTGRPEHAEQ